MTLPLTALTLDTEWFQNERHQELILEMAELKKYGAGSIGHESLSDAERPSDNLEIDEIMAKLEQVSPSLWL